LIINQSNDQFDRIDKGHLTDNVSQSSEGALLIIRSLPERVVMDKSIAMAANGKRKATVGGVAEVGVTNKHEYR
jgi:hypothetical protein